MLKKSRKFKKSTGNRKCSAHNTQDQTNSWNGIHAQHGKQQSNLLLETTRPL